MKKFFLLLMMSGFFGVHAKAQAFTVKGKLISFKPVDKIYLSYRDGDNTVQDSTQTKDGSFKFEGKVAEPTVARLQVKYEKQPGDEKPNSKSIQFILEGAKIDITAKDSLTSYTVTGSKGESDFEKLQKDEKVYDATLQPLYEAYGTARKAGNKEEMKKIEAQIRDIEKEIKEKVYKAFLKGSPNSPVAFYALQQYAGWDIDPDMVEPLFKTLPASQQQYASVIALKERIDIAKKTAVGRYAMDFIQNDTLGKPVSLSSFKGKYVLVDFWASWCGPCRQENPNVVKAFNKYKDKSFTILGVSLDRPNAQDRWLKAIHDDNLTWTHVSDLKFWDNEVAKQYGIRAIPQNLLIDPQGKIIARNLDGEELEQKLGEVLTK